MADDGLGGARERLRRARRQAGAGVARRPGRRGWSGPGPDERDPVVLADLVQHLRADPVVGQGVGQAQLVQAWPRVVGPAVAARTRALEVRDGVLVVEVADAVWAAQLRLLTPRLLASVRREAHGELVREVRLVLAGGRRGGAGRRGVPDDGTARGT